MDRQELTNRTGRQGLGMLPGRRTRTSEARSTVDGYDGLP